MRALARNVRKLMSNVEISLVWAHKYTGTSVPSDISWSSDDPIALTVIFYDREGPAEWLFARDLLSDAIELGHAGDGDVSAKVLDGCLFLTLASPYGTCVLETDYLTLSAFLDVTYKLAPREEEDTGIDLLIDNLLGD